MAVSRIIPIPAVVILSIFLVALASSANAVYPRKLNHGQSSAYAGYPRKPNHNQGTNYGVGATKNPWKSRNRMFLRSREFLDAHNKVRLSHKEPPLKWSKPLAKYAKQFAKQREIDCRMLHSQNSNYGENIFWAEHHQDWTPSKIVERWANESKFYDVAHNACAQQQLCGHYTQLVWYDTTKVGCAVANCRNGGLYAICSYDPPGNYDNESPFVQHLQQ